MHTQAQTFIFFGVAGSGKGTQVKLLMDFLKDKTGKDCIYAGTGDGFRALLSSGSYTAGLIKSSMERGDIQPDFLANTIIINTLISYLNPDAHLATDGYPRTLAQAKEFEIMMKFFKREHLKIINIELTKVEAIKRNMLRGRHDDTEEVVVKRFNEHQEIIVPAMNYLKGCDGFEFYEINGEQSIEQVHVEILKALNLNN